MNYLPTVQDSAIVGYAHYKYIHKLSGVGLLYLYISVDILIPAELKQSKGIQLYSQQNKRFGANCLKVRKRRGLNFSPLS